MKCEIIPDGTDAGLVYVQGNQPASYLLQKLMPKIKKKLPKLDLKLVEDQKENIFQLNCGKLDKSSGFISTNLSSSSIGILANINFNELVTDQPYDLVPNYVSPFIVHKKWV